VTGSGQGALIGLFVGLLFSLFFTGPEFFGVLAYTVLGATVFGGIFAAIAHALQRGRRDFASIGRRVRGPGRAAGRRRGRRRGTAAARPDAVDHR
jgi:hypothetical protein